MYCCIWLLIILSGFFSTAYGQDFWEATEGPRGATIRTIGASADSFVVIGTNNSRVYWSSDNGDTWTQSDDLPWPFFHISEIVASGGDVAFIATTGGGGIYRSTQSPPDWSQINNGLTNLNINTLVQRSPGVLFAGSRGGGVFRSLNNGDTWVALTSGLTDTRINALLTEGVTTLYAGTDTSGVFRSTNNGDTWNAVNNGLTNLRIRALARNATAIYAGTRAGIFRSTNNGTNWTAVNTGLDDLFILNLVSGSNDDLFTVNREGIFRSTDNGASWTAQNQGIASSRVGTIHASPNDALFAGLEHRDGIVRSTNNAASWENVSGDFTETLVNALISVDDDIMLAGTDARLHRSTDNGTTWDRIDDDEIPINLVNCLTDNDGEIFAGTFSGMFVSQDDGISWSPIEFSPFSNSGFAIAWTSNGNIYIGGGNGSVHRSADNGNTWEELILTGAVLAGLVVDDDDRIYAALSGGSVMRSTDFGDTWEEFFAGIPLTSTIRDLIITNSGRLLAATSEGVFFSDNSAVSWNALNSGLTELNTRELLENSRGDLFVATNDGVFRRQFNETSWAPVNGGLDPRFTRSLALNRDEFLFVGVNGGVVHRSLETTNLPVVDAGDDIEMCAGDTVQLEATARFGFSEYAYQWTPTAGLSDATILNPIAFPTVTTEYTLTITDELGSVASSQLTITVSAQPLADAGADITLCFGESAQLTASGGVTYAWEPSLGLSCDDCADPVASPEQTTVYTLTAVNDEGCAAADEITVEVIPLPAADPGPDRSICQGEQVQITLPGNAQYVWTPAEGMDDPTSANPVFFPLSTTTYSVTARNEFGCEAMGEFTITVLPRPRADAGSDATICSGESLTLNATGGVEYQWEPAEGLSCVDCRNPVASPNTDIEYTVTVTNAEGCEDTDNVHISVLPAPNVTLASESLEFGELDECQTSRDLEITLSNSSAYDIDFTSVEFGSVGYTLVEPVTPFNVASNGETTLVVRFAPPTAGQFDGEMELIGAPCAASVSAILRGSKTGETVSVIPSSITFTKEFVCDNDNLDTMMSVRNTGNSDLTLRNATVDTPFEILAPAFPLTLGSGESTDIVIGYAQKLPVALNRDMVVAFETPSCDSELRIALNSVEPSAAVDAGPDALLCSGESIELQGTGGVLYQWEPAAGLSDPTIPNPIASPDQTTIYTLRVVDEFGCEGEDPVVVTVVPTEKPEIIREGTTLRSSVTTGDIQWRRNGADIPGATGPTYEVEESGVYEVAIRFGAQCLEISDPVSMVIIVGIADRAYTASAFYAYPNPAHEFLRITGTLGMSGWASLELVDIFGKQLRRLRVQTPDGVVRTSLALYDLTPGVYFLRLQWASGSQTIKVLKE